MSSRNFIVAGILASALLVGALFIYTNSQTSEAATLAPNTKIRINLDTSFSLNVRRTPAGEKIGTQQGQSTGCVEEISGDWAKINYDQGQAGWSSSKYLTAIGTCREEKTNRIKVNILQGTTLTVRSSPAGTKIGEQANGAEGTKVGEPELANGRLWQNVDFDSDPDGWVAASLIVPIVIVQKPDCPQGTLPKIALPSVGDAFGRDWVPIGDGETHTYCYNQDFSTNKIEMMLVDRTGAEQCSWNTTEYIPPAGSGLKTHVDTGRGSSANFFDSAGLPQGIWRIRITEAVKSGCSDTYGLLVKPGAHISPTPTPTPTAVECPQGTLPPINLPGAVGWGRDRVPIGDGEVHTYCFVLNFFTPRLRMSIIGQTGASQCSQDTTEYIPPANESGQRKQVGSGYTFFDPAGLPQGTWLIRTTGGITPNCRDKYRVIVMR